jgi:hypothetical protein
LSAGATGASDAGKAIIDALGIDGRWAANCSRPASIDNPYRVFETFRAGPAVERLVAPPAEDRVAELLDVRRLKTKEVVWTIEDEGVSQTVTSKLDGNRMRIVSITGPDGTSVVKDARLADGTTTPWLSKCETN